MTAEEGIINKCCRVSADILHHRLTLLEIENTLESLIMTQCYIDEAIADCKKGIEKQAKSAFLGAAR